MGRRRVVKKTKLTLSLGAETVKRLRVHSSLSGGNLSESAEGILRPHLMRWGKGRSLGEFATLDPEAPEGEGHAA